MSRSKQLLALETHFSKNCNWKDAIEYFTHSFDLFQAHATAFTSLVKYKREIFHQARNSNFLKRTKNTINEQRKKIRCFVISSSSYYFIFSFSFWNVIFPRALPSCVLVWKYDNNSQLLNRNSSCKLNYQRQ